MFGNCNVRSVEKLPLVDAKTPFNVQLTAFYKRSFAYYTVKERLPIILTKVIDHLAKDRDDIIKEFGPGAEEEIKSVIGYISKLKNEIMTNKRLALITVRSDDTKEWNDLIENVDDPYFFTCVWLFTECYVYRRLREAFQLQQTLVNMDPFRQVKDASFVDSMLATCQLANYVYPLLEIPDVPVKGKQPVSHLETFQQFLRMNLWGNKCDLSLSVGEEVTQDKNPILMVNQLMKYILVDDSEKIFSNMEATMNETIDKDVIVDIVCDNSGYELITDFCFADFLITHNFANQIRFHIKLIPWFVSDATPRDMEWVIDSCLNANFSTVVQDPKEGTQETVNAKNLKLLGRKWKNYVKSGMWSWKADHFWTTPHEYYKMKELDKALYNSLSEASIVFFKGDLNYRKLMGEMNWPPTTPFETALREFFPCPLVAVRTVKADLVSGLPPHVQEQLNAKDEKWMEKGDYGLIQYCNRKIVLEHEFVKIEQMPTERKGRSQSSRGKSKSPKSKSGSPARSKSPKGKSQSPAAKSKIPKTKK